MKGILDAETSQILRCTMLGIEGHEVMTVLRVAVNGGSCLIPLFAAASLPIRRVIWK
jgi:hypothetical protein